MGPLLPSSHQLHVCEFAEDFIVFYLHLARFIDANPGVTIPFSGLSSLSNVLSLITTLSRALRFESRSESTILKGVNNMVVFDNKITADLGGRYALDCHPSGVFNRVVFMTTLRAPTPAASFGLA